MDALLKEIRRELTVREILSTLANDSLAGTIQEDGGAAERSAATVPTSDDQTPEG